MAYFSIVKLNPQDNKTDSYHQRTDERVIDPSEFTLHRLRCLQTFRNLYSLSKEETKEELDHRGVSLHKDIWLNLLSCIISNHIPKQNARNDHEPNEKKNTNIFPDE